MSGRFPADPSADTHLDAKKGWSVRDDATYAHATTFGSPCKTTEARREMR